MSVMIGELYTALKSAGASEIEAQKAAESVAKYENSFAELKGEMLLVKWMLGFNLAISVAILFKIFGA